MHKSLLNAEGVEVLPRVGICIPSGDMVHADFAIALAGLIRAARVPIAIINGKSSNIAKGRNNCVDIAQKLKCTHILFIDSDMVFPSTSLDRLLAHGKDIIGAVYRRRSPPYEVMGHSLIMRPHDVDGGIVEMLRVPTGLLLISMKVIDAMTPPYFRFEFIENAPLEEQTVGEDYYFCNTARSRGFSIWAEIDLSKEVGHIGNQILSTAEEKADAAVA